MPKLKTLLHRRPRPATVALAAFAAMGMLLGQSPGQAKAGDPTPNLGFALFDDSGALADGTVADFQNKVLILYYYAPW